jgi:DNA-binding transcriptional ArsR family regulator
MSSAEIFRALASERRLLILAWLRDPVAHFPPQTDGDLRADGVCAVAIAARLGISQPSLSGHMKVLLQADLVIAKRTRQWIFYRRNEARIRELQAGLLADL